MSDADPYAILFGPYARRESSNGSAINAVGALVGGAQLTGRVFDERVVSPYVLRQLDAELAVMRRYIAQRAERRRLALGLTQAAAARQAGIAPATWSRAVRGGYCRAWTVQMLFAWAGVTGRDCWFLLGAGLGPS